MKLSSRSGIALVVAIACAQPRTAPEPDNSKTVPLPTPPLILPPFQMDTSLTGDQVPEFSRRPYITWGPLPPGTTHVERTRSYDLRHQATTVRFDWDRRAVVGTTTLRIGALNGAAPLSDLVIDAGDMTFKSVTNESGPLKYDYNGSALTVHLPAPLTGAGETSIAIDYDGPNRTAGAYFKRKHVVFTQGETESTHFWVPTYDYPNDKTTWEFYIWTAKGERALSNGRLAGSRTVGDSVEWHWVQDKPASTYLMTTVIGNYTVLQDKPWRAVPVGYWTYPDSIQAASRGFAKTPKAIDVFSRKIGVPYPWAKYDQIVVPDFQFGGMENVTATTQNDAEILHPAWSEPQAVSTPLMAHELAHQWYGDLLTVRSWTHAWLSEGFATLFEHIFSEEDQGRDEGAYARLDAQEQTIQFERAARRPLVYDKWETDAIELFITGHVYQKGALVLEMLRHQLGDDQFWKAMNHYTTAHAYENVVTDDLRVSFEEATGKDLKGFFQQWVYGAGFPVYQVSSLYDRAARRLVISAKEVQPRDSLTGFFDTDVDVEARTDSGIVRLVVPMRNGSGEAGINLKSPPRSIRWDKGNWILDITDFPRSTRMLVYQLVNDDDVLGRIEAVQSLAGRPADPRALTALIAAGRNDKFWAVRARAVAAIGAWASDETRLAVPTMRGVRAALFSATLDPDARIRQEAVTAMGYLAHGTAVPLDVTSRLREIARSDRSLIVRGAALAADIRLEKEAAIPLAQQLMAPEVWGNVIRTPALEALSTLDTPEARSLVQKYAPAR